MNDMTWQQIREIVQIADDLAPVAAQQHWTEQQYYERIIIEFYGE